MFAVALCYGTSLCIFFSHLAPVHRRMFYSPKIVSAMERVFVISFHYKGRDYMAFVSHLDNKLNISFAHPSLKSIIPEGKVVYNFEDGMEIDHMELTPAQDLTLAVLAAIQQKGLHFQSDKPNPSS